jgi:hypothetical protein
VTPCLGDSIGVFVHGAPGGVEAGVLNGTVAGSLYSNGQDSMCGNSLDVRLTQGLRSGEIAAIDASLPTPASDAAILRLRAGSGLDLCMGSGRSAILRKSP